MVAIVFYYLLKGKLNKYNILDKTIVDMLTL